MAKLVSKCAKHRVGFAVYNDSRVHLLRRLGGATNEPETGISLQYLFESAL